ncbi:hypothetical protein, partial [Shinella sp.]|uniref:hypothetical protein n=1 Tax=Shinella sp. TaxID=1870904 RepID=UPI0028AF8CB3
QPAQDEATDEGASPAVSPVVGSTDKPGAVDELDGPSAAHGPLEETGSDQATGGTLEKDNADVPTDNTASLDDAAPKIKKTAKAVSRRRSGRPKAVETSAAVVQTDPVARTISEDMSGLNDEIRFLRAQLANKLRLQNTQLRKMLDRFER